MTARSFASLRSRRPTFISAARATRKFSLTIRRFRGTTPGSNDDATALATLSISTARTRRYVDGQKLTPYEPVRLRDGCRITVVEFELIFRVPAVGLKKDGEDRSTVLGSIDDLSSIRLARRLKHPADAFKAILDVIQALGGSDLDEKLGRALDGLMAVFPRAERGFILTTESDGSLPLRAVRHRGGPGETPSLSRTIARQVLEEAKAILISDVTIDEDYKAQQSVDSSLRTALAVPLSGSDGKPVGMIQLDSRASKEGFTAAELDLLAALAVPMGVAVENDTLLKKRASWAAAGQIQRALLPRGRPEIAGYTFWEWYRPVEEVGGDLYDYHPDQFAGAEENAEARWMVVRRRCRRQGDAGRIDDGRNLSGGSPSRPRRDCAGRCSHQRQPRSLQR